MPPRLLGSCFGCLPSSRGADDVVGHDAPTASGALSDTAAQRDAPPQGSSPGRHKDQPVSPPPATHAAPMHRPHESHDSANLASGLLLGSRTSMGQHSSPGFHLLSASVTLPTVPELDASASGGSPSAMQPQQQQQPQGSGTSPHAPSMTALVEDILAASDAPHHIPPAVALLASRLPVSWVSLTALSPCGTHAQRCGAAFRAESPPAAGGPSLGLWTSPRHAATPPAGRASMDSPTAARFQEVPCGDLVAATSVPSLQAALQQGFRPLTATLPDAGPVASPLALAALPEDWRALARRHNLRSLACVVIRSAVGGVLGCLTLGSSQALTWQEQWWWRDGQLQLLRGWAAVALAAFAQGTCLGVLSSALRSASLDALASALVHALPEALQQEHGVRVEARLAVGSARLNRALVFTRSPHAPGAAPVAAIIVGSGSSGGVGAGGGRDSGLSSAALRAKFQAMLKARAQEDARGMGASGLGEPAAGVALARASEDAVVARGTGAGQQAAGVPGGGALQQGRGVYDSASAGWMLGSTDATRPPEASGQGWSDGSGGSGQDTGSSQGSDGPGPAAGLSVRTMSTGGGGAGQAAGAAGPTPAAVGADMRRHVSLGHGRGRHDGGGGSAAAAAPAPAAAAGGRPASPAAASAAAAANLLRIGDSTPLGGDISDDSAGFGSSTPSVPFPSVDTRSPQSSGSIFSSSLFIRTSGVAAPAPTQQQQQQQQRKPRRIWMATEGTLLMSALEAGDVMSIRDLGLYKFKDRMVPYDLTLGESTLPLGTLVLLPLCHKGRPLGAVYLLLRCNPTKALSIAPWSKLAASISRVVFDKLSGDLRSEYWDALAGGGDGDGGRPSQQPVGHPFSTVPTSTATRAKGVRVSFEEVHSYGGASAPASPGGASGSHSPTWEETEPEAEPEPDPAIANNSFLANLWRASSSDAPPSNLVHPWNPMLDSGGGGGGGGGAQSPPQSSPRPSSSYTTAAGRQAGAAGPLSSSSSALLPHAPGAVAAALPPRRRSAFEDVAEQLEAAEAAAAAAPNAPGSRSSRSSTLTPAHPALSRVIKVTKLYDRHVNKGDRSRQQQGFVAAAPQQPAAGAPTRLSPVLPARAGGASGGGAQGGGSEGDLPLLQQAWGSNPDPDRGSSQQSSGASGASGAEGSSAGLPLPRHPLWTTAPGAASGLPTPASLPPFPTSERTSDQLTPGGPGAPPAALLGACVHAAPPGAEAARDGRSLGAPGASMGGTSAPIELRAQRPLMRQHSEGLGGEEDEEGAIGAWGALAGKRALSEGWHLGQRVVASIGEAGFSGELAVGGARRGEGKREGGGALADVDMLMQTEESDSDGGSVGRPDAGEQEGEGEQEEDEVEEGQEQAAGTAPGDAVAEEQQQQRRRRRQRQRQLSSSGSDDEDVAADAGASAAAVAVSAAAAAAAAGAPSASSSLRLPLSPDLEAWPELVEIGGKLARTRSKLLYAGKLHGRPVAIKILRLPRPPARTSMLSPHHAELLQRLMEPSLQQHPNVLATLMVYTSAYEVVQASGKRPMLTGAPPRHCKYRRVLALLTEHVPSISLRTALERGMTRTSPTTTAVPGQGTHGLAGAAASAGAHGGGVPVLQLRPTLLAALGGRHLSSSSPQASVSPRSSRLSPLHSHRSYAVSGFAGSSIAISISRRGSHRSSAASQPRTSAVGSQPRTSGAGSQPRTSQRSSSSSQHTGRSSSQRSVRSSLRSYAYAVGASPRPQSRSSNPGSPSLAALSSRFSLPLDVDRSQRGGGFAGGCAVGMPNLPLITHILCQVASAVQALHAAGLLHGELRPENVLLVQPPPSSGGGSRGLLTGPQMSSHHGHARAPPGTAEEALARTSWGVSLEPHGSVGSPRSWGGGGGGSFGQHHDLLTGGFLLPIEEDAAPLPPNVPPLPPSVFSYSNSINSNGGYTSVGHASGTTPDGRPRRSLSLPRDVQVKLKDAALCSVCSVRGLVTVRKLAGRQRPSSLVYLGPEVLHGQRPRRASDAYAFGLLMWEMYTGRGAGEDRVWPTTVPAWYLELAESCCSPAPKARPPFKRILARLQRGGDGKGDGRRSGGKEEGRHVESDGDGSAGATAAGPSAAAAPAARAGPRAAHVPKRSFSGSDLGSYERVSG